MVADYTTETNRGHIFGMLYFATNVGQVLTCLLVTPASSQQIHGIDGWRVALLTIGFLSIGLACLVPWCVAEAPRPFRTSRMMPGRVARKLGSFFRIPTFALLSLQGVFGTIPGAAMSFVTMFFQYVGITDFDAALLISVHVIGDACGGMLGGIIGDALARWSPRYGRPLTAHLSVLSAIPSVALLFYAIPRQQSMTSAFAGILFLHGLFSSWAAPGCICPAMCDIIPRSSLGLAYAWQLGIAYSCGSVTGPLMVGHISRLSGYEINTDLVTDMSEEARRKNAKALGHALFMSSSIPYAICATLFVVLFFVYDKDARKVSMATDSDEAAETQSTSARAMLTPPGSECTSLLAQGSKAS
jgi:hypothetical protein